MENFDLNKSRNSQAIRLPLNWQSALAEQRTTRPAKRSKGHGSGLAVLIVGLVALAGFFTPLHISWQTADGTEEIFPIATLEEAHAENLPLPTVNEPGERYILVSLADQRMQVYEHGSRIMEAVISSGKERLPTPKGTFHLMNKSPRAYSKVASLWMPYWMAFTFRDSDQHYLGFHDLPEYADGSKEGLEHLGLPYSGGCIRLNSSEAKQLYDWARVGDLVIIN